MRHDRLKNWQRQSSAILRGGGTGHGIERTYSVTDVYRIAALHHLTGLGVSVGHAVAMAGDVASLLADPGHAVYATEGATLHWLILFARRADGRGWDRYDGMHGRDGRGQPIDDLPHTLPLLAGRPAIMVDTGAMHRDLEQRIADVLKGRKSAG